MKYEIIERNRNIRKEYYERRKQGEKPFDIQYSLSEKYSKSMDIIQKAIYHKNKQNYN